MGTTHWGSPYGPFLPAWWCIPSDLFPGARIQTQEFWSCIPVMVPSLSGPGIPWAGKKWGKLHLPAYGKGENSAVTPSPNQLWQELRGHTNLYLCDLHKVSKGWALWLLGLWGFFGFFFPDSFSSNATPSLKRIWGFAGWMNGLNDCYGCTWDIPGIVQTGLSCSSEDMDRLKEYRKKQGD